MWSFILLAGLVVLFVWGVTRTNLYRHRGRHGPEPGGVDPRNSKALDNTARFRRDGLRLGPANKRPR
jgi:hypothetical protein